MMANRSSTERMANGETVSSEVDLPLAIRHSLHRSRIVAEARGWIGTPYRHQGSAKGVGCDCLGLVRGVWRAVYGSEAEPVPAYSSDWGQVTGEETMLAAARRHLVEVAADDLRPGNVVVFRMHRRAIAKHAGILTASGEWRMANRETGPSTGAARDPQFATRHSPFAIRFIHAYQPMRVAENWLDDWWAKRIAAVFEFPGMANSE